MWIDKMVNMITIRNKTLQGDLLCIYLPRTLGNNKTSLEQYDESIGVNIWTL